MKEKTIRVSDLTIAQLEALQKQYEKGEANLPDVIIREIYGRKAETAKTKFHKYKKVYSTGKRRRRIARAKKTLR